MKIRRIIIPILSVVVFAFLISLVFPSIDKSQVSATEMIRANKLCDYNDGLDYAQFQFVYFFNKNIIRITAICKNKTKMVFECAKREE